MALSGLDVALISGPAYDPLYGRIGEFERATGVPVRIRYRGTHPELNAHLASLDDPPYDLVSTHTKYAPSQTRFLSPLDEFAETLETASFYASIIELARIEGRLLGVPRNIDVKLLHYRADLLTAAPTTWEELVDAAMRVASENPVHGFVFTGQDSGLFGMFFELAEMAGARLFPDSRTPEIDNEGGVWALGILRKLYASGAVPRELVDWHYDEVHRYFRDGHAAMVCDWPGFFGSYADPEVSRVSESFRVARMPAGPLGKHKAYGGCHTFARTRRGAAKREAVDLLRFLTAPDQQRLEARHGSVPVRPAILTELVARATPAEARRWHLLETVIANDILVPPALAYYPEIEEMLWRTVQAAMTGATEIRQALTEMAEGIANCHRRHAEVP
jgi:multiple sugar transport system substrate-binding protein